MFELFSQSYYLGRLYVTPTDHNRALMHRDQHERLNEQVYATGDGIEALDSPLVMKLESQHFPVHGDEGVPANTLALPEPLLEGADLRNPPSLREIFLARRERAQQLLAYAGGLTATPDEHTTN
ncbi:hypothetical protein G6M89_05585 [Natronolimnobius sp. AArcel1]|uniref:DUF5802 family protein n=1 Tax=Natronolimnobius sp. AArcel1 TaxID=1679093 RepID=UPI0013EE178F|nr:DUF5802 family protein [Natronolimnobius sp. AArcel1]NGM68486.1 hypothetical protein [Natronolimnobius sp. AArcel1]